MYGLRTVLKHAQERAGWARRMCVSSEATGMLDHVRSLDQSAWDQGRDILQGGVNRALSAPDAQGDCVTLSLALAEMSALKRDWAAVLDASDPIINFHNGNKQSLLPASQHDHWAAGTQLHCTAALALGRDEHFQRLRLELAKESSSAVGSAIKLDMHALSSLNRTFTSGQAWAGTTHRETMLALPHLHRAWALTHFGLADLAMVGAALQGDSQEAHVWLAGAEELLEAGDDRSVFLFPDMWRARAAADVALGRAQVAMAEKKWEAAEELLSTSVRLNEEAYGSGDGMVALLLALTGQVYARTGRVVFAEGLLREAAKMLRLSPDSEQPAADTGVHPSAAALVSWQLAQLYTALPKREAEAGKWAQLARKLWPYGGDVSEDLGSENALTGKGTRGKVFAVLGQCGRVFPGTSERI